MQIFYVPIEPLEERYTESWYRNIPAFFRSKGAEVVVIDGQPLTTTVETGTFLDINSTIHYKCSQMQAIAKLFRTDSIQSGDVFFFGDIEFWGLEGLRLMAQLNKKDIFICGVLHAASYSIEDTFSVAAPYQKYTELGWLAACDKVFVGSKYHRQAILERRLLPFDRGAGLVGSLYDKIEVTGLPLFKSDYQPYPEIKKKNQMIIAGRLDWEKRPNLGLNMAYLLYRKYGVQTVVTVASPHCNSNRKWLIDYAQELAKDGVINLYSGLSKIAYHSLLAESKVLLSNTVEENFGYCVMEACIYGCCPIVRRAYSHPELLEHNENLLFDTEDEIPEKVLTVLNAQFPQKKESWVKHYAERYYESTDRILKEINRMREVGYDR